MLITPPQTQGGPKLCLAPSVFEIQSLPYRPEPSSHCPTSKVASSSFWYPLLDRERCIASAFLCRAWPRFPTSTTTHTWGQLSLGLPESTCSHNLDACKLHALTYTCLTRKVSTRTRRTRLTQTDTHQCRTYTCNAYTCLVKFELKANLTWCIARRMLR